MKKRCVSIALALAMVFSMVPAAGAAEAASLEDGFLLPVAEALPEKQSEGLMLGDVEPPDAEGSGFIAELSGDMPEIREDGFLAEPTAPLKSFPEAGKLLAEVGKADAEATSIATAAELAAMTTGGNYVLTADIDLSGENWTPVNEVSDITLDGQGHTISGMTIDGVHWAAGLFGRASNMTIRNLIVKSPTFISAQNYVGSLIGYAKGAVTIENCSVEGLTTTAGNKFAGLVGYFDDKEGSLTIQDCAVDIALDGVAEDGTINSSISTSASGLVGYITAKSIQFTDCLVHFDSDCGGYGLVGSISESGDLSLLRCAMTGTETSALTAGMSNAVGVDTCTVTDCVFEGTLAKESTNARTAGFFGRLFASTSAVFTNCRAEGSIPDVTANSNGAVAAFVGQAYTGALNITFRSCLAAMDINVIQNTTGTFYVGGLMGYASGSTGSFYAVDCVNTGDLIQSETVEDTIYFGGMVGYFPAGGQFLRCENRGNITSEYNVGGLVGCGSPLTFTDCKNSGAISTHTQLTPVGGLLGYGIANMYNCVNTGDLTGGYVGGMLGRASAAGSVFKDCRASFHATVLYRYGGGLVGESKTCQFTNCAADVSFSLPTTRFVYAGGLMGAGDGSVERCSTSVCFSGDQLTDPSLGGMIASVSSTTSIQASTAAFNIDEDIVLTSSGSLGGLIGYAGSNSPISINNCAVQVDIQTPSVTTAGLSDGAGGLVGYSYASVAISDSYVTGNIGMCAENYGGAHGVVGGLVGNMRPQEQSLTIERCWTDVDISDAATMGGLVGYADVSVFQVSSSWADGTLSFGNAAVGNNMGGLVGYSSNMNGRTGYSSSMVMQDCCFLGKLDCADAGKVGGLVGDGAALIYNCYSTADVVGNGITANESYLGGIAGVIGGVASYCYFGGTVTNPYGNAGGIVAQGDAANCRSTATVHGSVCAGGILGRGEATNCTFNGIVTGNSYVGGIAGAGSAEGCTSSGTVQGHTIGGIIGSLSESRTVIDCTSSAYLYPCADCEQSAHYIGGIVGRSSGSYSTSIVNCHYERHLQITLDGRYLYAGGIAGGLDNGSIVNCSSQGITVYATGSYAYAAGIAGRFSGGTLENCRVDGNIYVRAWDGSDLYTGGLVGSGSQINAADCAVNGNVSAYLTLVDSDGKYAKVDAGGLAGNLSSLTVENCQFTGTLSESAQFSSDSDRNNLPFLGDGHLYYSDVPGVDIPEKPIEGYQVVVKAMHKDGTIQAMPGITVYANSTNVGTTDETGQVTFKSDRFSSTSLVWLSASADGYFESRHCTYLADGGSFTLILKEKDPGEIYFKSALIVDEETGTSDLLSYLTDLRIHMLDTTARPLTVEIDWNDLDESPRTAKLMNEDGSHCYELPEHGNITAYVDFAERFDIGEDIYLYACGTKDGETVEKNELLGVKVQSIDIHMPTEEGNMDVGGSGDTDDTDHLYFLRGLQIGLDFDDLEKLASGVSYKNGTLTVKFDAKSHEEKKISVWSGFTEKVSLGGEVKIPISNLNEGEWSGTVNVGINQEVETDVSNKSIREENEKHLKKDEFDKANLTYDFVIGGVPCFLETGLEVGGTASFGVHGPAGQTYVDAEIAVLGGASIFAGLGGEVTREVEFKVGGEGELNVDLPMKFDTANESAFSLDPEIKGDVNAKVSVKAFLVELEGKLRIGGFVWNKNGAVWTAFNEEAVPALAVYNSAPTFSTSDWIAMPRDYLANGGGFIEHDVSALSFNTAARQNLRYENIAALTETAMAAENGQLVLYFTADDGSDAAGGANTHTALWCTVRQSDGSWSAPVIVSGGESGYPASPSADGPFVVWAESSAMDTLDEMLTSTQIKAAVNGGDIHTFETEGYVYAPKVSASADGTTAMVSWLCDPEVNSENLLGGTPTLYYATYKDGDWSSVYKQSTSGTPAGSYPDAANGYLYYRSDAGKLLKNKTTVRSNFTGRGIVLGAISAEFDEEDVLRVYNSSSVSKTVQTNYCGTEDPVLCQSSDGALFLFWPEADGVYCITKGSDSSSAWSDPICFAATEQVPRNLAAAVVDGEPVVTYTQTSAEGQTDLYTASMAADGVDLGLYSIGYETSDMVERGYLVFRGEVYNAGLTGASGYSVTATDEKGNQVYTYTRSDAVTSGGFTQFSAAFAPDGQSEHTYTFTVQPIVDGAAVTDADMEDNSLSITVGQPSAEIVDANFYETAEGGVQLQAMIQNTGAAQLNGVTVKITAGGGNVLSKTYRGEEAIPTASIRQLLVDGAQPNTYYEITVLHGDEVLDSVMLMYEDPDAPTLGALDVTVSGDDAQLQLVGQNQTGSGKVILAVYDGSRMAAVGAKSLPDLNGKQKVALDLSDALAPGSYSYKVFFLSETDGYAPLSSAVSGALTVGT